jgi:GH15 family glucan-1,4-alpha-glucosidase
LISNTGSLDWLCLPHFHSPSFFNRLLDHVHGGYFVITPAQPFTTRRFYQDSTAVPVTEFHTDSGIVRLTDCMPVAAEAMKHERLMPFRAVLRCVKGVQGTVELTVAFKPRPDHGRLVTRIQARGRLGYAVDLGGRLLHLVTQLRLSETMGMLQGRVEIRAGRREAFWVTYAEDAPAVYPSLNEAEATIQETAQVWRRWLNSCTYQGASRQAVRRSALTLKLLSYAPSGAIVAAPTCSLPRSSEGCGTGITRPCRSCTTCSAKPCCANVRSSG